MSCRESKSERPNTDSVSPSIPVSPENDTVLRSRSVTEGYNEQVGLRGPFNEYRRVASDNHRIIFSGPPSGGTLRANFPSMSSDRSPSVASRFSSSSYGEMVGDSPTISLARTEGNETAIDSSTLHHFIPGHHQPSSPSIVS